MGFNPNKTTSTGLAPGMLTEWCDRVLLEMAKYNLVHEEGAVKKSMPAQSGKVAQCRRWVPLPVLLDVLPEAEIPDGQDREQEEVFAYVYPYGGYITNSDEFDLFHMDSKLSDAIEQVSDQGTRSKDALIRDVMAETTTVQYANSKTHIYDLATTDELNVTEIRKMVRTLKKNKTPTFKSGGKSYYMAILGPDGEFDIQSDTAWRYPKEYVDTQDIYNGEIGMIYGVRFLQTTEGLVYENDELIDGQTYLSVEGANSTVTVPVKEAITTAEAAALADRYVSVYDATDGTYRRRLIDHATSGAAGACDIVLTADPTITCADGDMLYANEYGQNGNPVYGTFIFGDNAYAIWGTKGSDKVRTIVKTKEEIGGPLEQFGTVGWKIPGMAVAITQPLWLGVVLHGASE
jgi:N4-gp56 family major capsid protein